MSRETQQLAADAGAAGLDWPAIARHLAGHGLDLARDSAPQRFAGGLANRNFLVHVDASPTVLRCPPSGPLPPGAHDMAREHRILSRLPDALAFVPRSLHLCEDRAVTGVPFQLLEYRPGLIIRDRLPAGMGPAEAARLSDTLIHTLAALHHVDPASVGLDGLGRPEGFLARSAEGWQRRGLACDDPAATPLIRKLGAWLARNQAPDGPPTLLHNDFKLDNLILAPDLSPAALVDWDQGTRGDPLFDLATLLSYWTEAGDPPVMHQLAQMPTAAPGFPSRQVATEAYARLTGRDLSPFRFHRVLGILKLGVIFLQLHALLRRGATADPRYAAFGPLAAGLLEFALDVAAGRRF